MTTGFVARGPLACLLISPGPALAWGPLGHRMIAETAAVLLEARSPWGPLLARHRVELGTYSTYPDAVFRHIDGHGGKLEAPTHFFDLDLLPAAADRAAADAQVAAIPCDYAAARLALTERMAPDQIDAMGSLPWRVAQLLDRAAGELAPVQGPVGGTYLVGSTAEGDAGRIFRALYLLGVMSHYSGDGLMPYHASVDADGWKTGHGGIHYYYESSCVNALEPGLNGDVLQAALRHQVAWLASWRAESEAPATVVMQALLDSAHAIAEVERLDRTAVRIEPSDPATGTPARRRPAKTACRVFRRQLVERLAKAAALTAWLWERALPEGADLSQAAKLQFSDIVSAPPYLLPDLGGGCGDGRKR